MIKEKDIFQFLSYFLLEISCDGPEWDAKVLRRESELNWERVPVTTSLQLWRWREEERVMRRQPQAWALAREGLKAHSRVGTRMLGSIRRRVVASVRPAEHGPWERESQREGLAQSQPSDLRRAVLWDRGCRQQFS